jgi:hypothetical protein
MEACSRLGLSYFSFAFGQVLDIKASYSRFQEHAYLRAVLGRVSTKS